MALLKGKGRLLDLSPVFDAQGDLQDLRANIAATVTEDGVDVAELRRTVNLFERLNVGERTAATVVFKRLQAVAEA